MLAVTKVRNVAAGVEDRNIYLCSTLCMTAIVYGQSNNTVPPTTELIVLADMKGV